MTDPVTGPVPEIDVEALEARLAAGAVLFDVREVNEYEAARVAGGRLVPLGTVADRIAEFPTTGEVLVICKAGGRSMTACEFLRAQGVDAVNIAGGTMAWLQSGRASESGPVAG